MSETIIKILLLPTFIIILLVKCTKSDFENCLVKEAFRTQVPATYKIVNCSENTYCCDAGCCTSFWYTGPLAIFLVVVVLCCATCCKACYDVFSENVNTEYESAAVQCRIAPTNNVQIHFSSPPPAYSVAIYMPQPPERQITNRIPSYEEVIGR